MQLFYKEINMCIAVNSTVFISLIKCIHVWCCDALCLLFACREKCTYFCRLPASKRKSTFFSLSFSLSKRSIDKMDDLLDLSWSAPSSSAVKQQPPQKPQKPKDAFADLLSSSTTPKPVDISQLSLVERQKLQQQQQQPSNTSSPWLTPTQATTPLSPSNHTSRYTPPSSSTLEAKQAPSANNTNTSSFENLLDPFGSSKRQTDDRSTPLNQL